MAVQIRVEESGFILLLVAPWGKAEQVCLSELWRKARKVLGFQNPTSKNKIQKNIQQAGSPCYQDGWTDVQAMSDWGDLVPILPLV